MCLFNFVFNPIDKNLNQWKKENKTYCLSYPDLYNFIKEDPELSVIIKSFNKSGAFKKKVGCPETLNALFIQPKIFLNTLSVIDLDQEKEEEILYLIEDYQDEVGSSPFENYTFDPSYMNWFSFFRD